MAFHQIFCLTRDIYEGSRCQILHEGKPIEYIKFTAGVCQGCILSPIVFLFVLDRVMRRMTGGRKRGIQWDMRDRLEDTDFTDDIHLLAQRFGNVEEKLR
jgi:hypothetical protein